MSQTSRTAEWVADLRWEDLPPEVIQQAKQCLLDFIGCAVGGTQTVAGRIALEAALSWGGPEEATLIGAPSAVGARHAAFANATVANALDYDDTLHGHPGATTFPTALAAAEKWHATPQAFIVAVVAGYELSVRAMALLKPCIPRFKAMWDLGTLQALGAAATASRLAGLPATGVAHTLGIVAGTAPVPLPRKERQPGEGRSMLKSAYGWAADAAIVAADLVRLGFTGPDRALDDNMGFWEVALAADLGISDFSEGLGEQWALLHVEFKPYMACRFIHPVLEGVENLIQLHGVSADAIESAEVRSFALLADAYHNIPRPMSATDAQFSVPYTVAALLSGGSLTPSSYSDAALCDPDLLDLSARVDVCVDAEFEAAYPGRLGAQVQLTLRNGEVYRARVDHPKGSIERPLSAADLGQKFRSLVDPVLGAVQAQVIREQVDALEEIDTVHPLTQLLCRANDNPV